MSSTGRGYYGNPRYDPPRTHSNKDGDFNILSPSGFAAWIKWFKEQQAKQQPQS